MKRRDNQASITVFLSLVLFLILAFLTVTLEAARVSAARSYTYQLLDLAASSVLAEYNLPLYEEYHIFGLDAGFGSATLSKEKLQEHIKESMQYTLEPLKNTSEHLLLPQSSFMLWNIGIKDCKVRDITSLLDFEGALFYQEAIDYMKYREVTKGVELMLSQFSLLKETDSSSTILQEKLKVEEQLAVLDVKMLELFELIDGIRFKNGQILMKRNGEVQCADSFVKQLNIAGVTAQGVGINHPKLFNVLENLYYQPIVELENLKENGIAYIQLVTNEKAILEEQRLLGESLELLDSGVNNPDMRKTRLEEIEEQIDLIEDAKEKREKDAIRWNKQRLEMKKKTLEVLKKTITVIDRIQKEQKMLQPTVEGFQMEVEQLEGTLGDEFYEEISGSLEEMKSYVGIGGENSGFKFDLEAMKTTLQGNIDVLNNALSIFISYLPNVEDELQLTNWIRSILDLQSIYRQFSSENLIFDYSGIQFETQKTDITKNITTLLQNGLLGLVFEDLDSISNAKIKKELLPTTWKNYSEEGNGEALEKINFDLNANSRLLGDCVENAELYNVPDVIEDVVQTLAEKFLYVEYLREHFSNYNTKEKKENQVLDYELEYIIEGKSADKDNITTMVMKLVGIRLLLNTLYVVTDRKMSAEASTMAALIVGFSGLPFLVSTVKYLILFVWALEQSLIEVTALFQGKKVSVIPTKSSFCIQLTELLLMSKEKIHEKAREWKTEGISFHYDNYLMLFLLLQGKDKQIFRALDVIQENIRYRYKDDFLMQNCVFGFSVDLLVEMPQLFLEVPFLKKLDDRGIRGYGFDLTYSASY